MTASLASKVADLGGKFGSLAGQSLSHSLKLGVQVSDLTLDVANGAAQATHSDSRRRPRAARPTCRNRVPT